MNKAKKIVCSITSLTQVILCTTIALFTAQQTSFANNTHSTQQGNSASTVYLKAIPSKKYGIYKAHKKFAFDLLIKNLINEKQRGTLQLEIKSVLGGSVYKNNSGILLEEKKGYNQAFAFKNMKLDPGVYTTTIMLSTNKSATNHHFSFAVSPDKINYNPAKPKDFDQFWEEAKKELSFIDPKYKLVNRKDYSNNHHNIYEIEYKSLDNENIKGWLTIPKKSGKKIPVLVVLPDYVTELKAEERNDMAVLSLHVRGVGKSTEKMKPDFGQYLTYNLNNKKKYIYRGVYMDCLRAIDFVRKQGLSLKLDPTRIAVGGYGQGGSLAAVTAALDGNVQAVWINEPIMIDVNNLLSYTEQTKQTSFWPANTLTQYLKNNKGSGMTKDMMLRNLSYFDPIHFIPTVKNAVLLGFSLKNTVNPSVCNYLFMSLIKAKKQDIKICDDCEGNKMDDTFSGFSNMWLNEQLY